MADTDRRLSRRRLIGAGATAVAAAAGTASWAAAPSQPAADGSAAPATPARAARPLPPHAAGKDAAALIVHSANTIETRREAFGSSVITPFERLYVRNNLPPPDPAILADREAWQLEVEGVRQPRSLALAELRRLGLATVPMVLQCSGNGRGFFPSRPSGTPWQVGAAGCVIWSGVPVASVVRALGGLAEGAAFITGTGGEPLPQGVDPRSVVVERSVPLRAMTDALLAWEINGAPIPLAHGGPLRLIVPGYSGVNQIKYIRRLAFTATESDARIMSHGYRLSPPGQTGDPAQPSVQEMSVKSWINSPAPGGPGLAPGTVQIHGVAFGGLHAVRRVEVSTDGGTNWRRASFVGPDLGRYAWRQFVMAATLGPGRHTLVSRAVDAKGGVQPRERLENASGYNNTSWLDHAVEVTVA